VALVLVSELRARSGGRAGAPPHVRSPDVEVFADYCEANGMVLLHPCMGGRVDRGRYPLAEDVASGLLDVYGQLGPTFVQQSAPHMRAIGQMLRRVLPGHSAAAPSQPATPPPPPPPPPPPVPAKAARRVDESAGMPPAPPTAQALQKMPTLHIDRASVLTAGCSNTGAASVASF
jgi:hypothetical protein